MDCTAGFALYLLDATFRIVQRMHVTVADLSAKSSQDGTLATLSFRWSNVAEVLPAQITHLTHVAQGLFKCIQGVRDMDQGISSAAILSYLQPNTVCIQFHKVSNLL